MSSSPTKGADALPSPPTSGRRRGHAHRRSGAISNHDLSAILKPSSTELNGLRSGSAPTTPSDPNSNRQFMPSLDRSASQPSLTCPQPTVPISPDSPHESSPATVQSRPRVGFSDTLEYIPRPLSTISSATSSSMSTIRPSHSLTGSITSIRSFGTSSPPSARKGSSNRETSGEAVRPKTTDFPEGSSPFDSHVHRFNTPVHRPLSSPNIPLLSNQDSVHDDTFQLDNCYPEAASREVGYCGTSDHGTQSTHIDIQLPQFQADILRLRESQDSPNLSLTRPRSSPEAKVSKHQRKGKSWAGLLSRRAKHGDATHEDPELISQQSTPTEEFSLDDITFDQDTTYVLRSPDYEAPRSAPPRNASMWKTDILPENEPSSVLDLDATWEALDIGSQAGSGRFGSPKRQMHSGSSPMAFKGAGMNYHRRTESAPVMAPVDYQLGLHRLGNSSQMANVFEEEEDEEGPMTTSDGRTRHTSTRKAHDEIDSGPGVKAVDTESESRIPPPHISKQKPLDDNSTNPDLSTEFSASLQPVQIEGTVDTMDDVSVEIVDAVDEPRFSVVTKSSDESTITPTLSSDALRGVQLPEPLELTGHGQRHFFPPEVSPLNHSPDFTKTSFDAPRLNTPARSSISDRSAWSSARTGESGHDTSYSIEDVPSLTSSASTTISHIPFSSTIGCQPEGERSLSFSAAVPRRTRPVSPGKRSSLASLSRLVGSSYSEKSKLSIESRPQTEEGEKSDRKKRNRLSRLMKFWKSKENLKT